MRFLALVLTAVAASLAAGGVAVGAGTVPVCETHDLRITEFNSQGAAGTHLLALAYKNRTRASCQTSGYPGVTLFGRAARSLTVAKRGPFGGTPRTLVLQPGKRAYGVISYGETPVPVNQRCPAVTAVRVYAPNSRQATRVAISNGGQYCHRAEVYPLASSARRSLNG